MAGGGGTDFTDNSSEIVRLLHPGGTHGARKNPDPARFSPALCPPARVRTRQHAHRTDSNLA
jgi:hypothetical protein